MMKLFFKILLFIQFVCLFVSTEDYPQSICSLEVDKGPCSVTVTRYYYDSNEKKCLKFDFGDCDNPFSGNANNFLTQASCEKLCIRGEFVSQESQPELCKLDREVGNCKMYVPSFYYNSISNKCEQFGYGGCNGNHNRFNLLPSCIETCVHA